MYIKQEMMKTGKNTTRKAQVAISSNMQSVCDFLEVPPTELLEQMMADLTSESGEAGEYYSMLMHLYVSERIAKRKHIDRGEVEDFLAHVGSLRKQLLRHETDVASHSPSELAISRYSLMKRKMKEKQPNPNKGK